MIKACADCRFHKEEDWRIRDEVKHYCHCLNKHYRASTIHEMRMIYSPHGKSYKHCGDIEVRVGCKFFEIRLRSYKEVVDLLKIVYEDTYASHNKLWQTIPKSGNIRPLFGGGGPYGEGFHTGFIEALQWVLYNYEIKKVEDLNI